MLDMKQRKFHHAFYKWWNSYGKPLSYLSIIECYLVIIFLFSFILVYTSGGGQEGRFLPSKYSYSITKTNYCKKTNLHSIS